MVAVGWRMLRAIRMEEIGALKEPPLTSSSIVYTLSVS
jgi:hypothetical protein